MAGTTAYPAKLDTFPQASAGGINDLHGQTNATWLHSQFHDNINAAVAAMQSTLIGPVIYNAKAAAYGAVGDGKRSLSGSITTGTNVLNDATNPYSSGDVGKTVWVTGAGPSNAMLKTTISTFNNAGQVLLAATASTTVTLTHVAWGTADTAALQAALSGVGAAQSGNAVGGLLWIPGGYYIVEHTAVASVNGQTNNCTYALSVPSNVTVMGSGLGVTTIVSVTQHVTGAAADAPDNVFVLAGVNNVLLYNFSIVGDVQAMPTPTTPTPTTTTATGSIPASQTYPVQVSLVTATGETAASATVNVTTGSGTATNTITIPAPAVTGNATGWYAYVGQNGGGVGTGTRQQVAGSPTALGVALTLTAAPTNTGAVAPTVSTVNDPLVTSPTGPLPSSPVGNGYGVYLCNACKKCQLNRVEFSGLRQGTICCGGDTTSINAGQLCQQIQICDIVCNMVIGRAFYGTAMIFSSISNFSGVTIGGDFSFVGIWNHVDVSNIELIWNNATMAHQGNLMQIYSISTVQDCTDLCINGLTFVGKVATGVSIQAGPTGTSPSPTSNIDGVSLTNARFEFATFNDVATGWTPGPGIQTLVSAVGSRALLNVYFTNCLVRTCKNDGFLTTAPNIMYEACTAEFCNTGTGNTGNGFKASSAGANYVNCYTTACQSYGWWVEGATSAECFYQNCQALNNTGGGIAVISTLSVAFINGCRLNNSAGFGVNLVAGMGVINSCDLTGCTTALNWAAGSFPNVSQTLPINPRGAIDPTSNKNVIQPTVQTITQSAALTAGTFTITINGVTTGAIQWNATAATVAGAVQTALQTAYGPNVTVIGTGGPMNSTTPVVLYLMGTRASVNIAVMSITGTGLTGGTLTPSVTQAGALTGFASGSLGSGSPTAAASAGTVYYNVSGVPITLICTAIGTVTAVAFNTLAVYSAALSAGMTFRWLPMTSLRVSGTGNPTFSLFGE